MLLEERVLMLLNEGPKSFDALKVALNCTGNELTDALESLEKTKHIHSDISTEFKWALLPMK